MPQQELYTAINDPYFAEPYIDEEGWREGHVRYYFVHGGFRNTEVQGNEVRFAFYFPEKERYEGRFYHYLSPAPEYERAIENMPDPEDDTIKFCADHGAYLVVSNQGGFCPGETDRIYKSSANTAMFSRIVAQRVYGYEHRPYGYVYGGSGGSFKTMSCIEATTGVWDGGAPFVLANPMGTPNAFCPRVKVMRLLGTEGMEKLVDAMEPGGSGNLLEGLDEHQAQAVIEATKMGFPKKAWFCHPYMGDGALMVLMPTIYQIFPAYFKDFWEKEGYEGADPASTEYRDRVRFVTTVTALIPREKKEGEVFNSVDNSWENTMTGNQTTPHIQVAELPPAGSHIFHSRLRVLTGDAAGKEQPIEEFRGNVIEISAAYDGQNSGNALEGLKVGDQVMIDNSDYLAIQCFHRHQVPDESYYVYDQYRKEDGTPKYPQLPMLISPMIAMGAGGSIPCGGINSKIIINCSLMDESAAPWFGDWYYKRVVEQKGSAKDWVRIYYNDNCIHDDRAALDDKQHQVDYLGMLHQSMLDLAAWVEKGIEPAPSTEYVLNDGQIEVENNARRSGLQPAVESWANGEKCVRVKVGEPVLFTAEIEAPTGCGPVTEAAWDFERTNDFTHTLPLRYETEDRLKATVSAEHSFPAPGTYFPVIKVKASRCGSLEDIFTQCKNLNRVRVIVEA